MTEEMAVNKNQYAVDQLPEALLEEYLSAQIPEFRGPLKVSKFAGGQSNPTFKLEAASGTYVLRRQPPGKLLKSAHAVDREFRVLRALENTGVPVPKVFHLCEDRELIGSMFYVMEFLEGRIFWNPALPEVETAAERSAIFDECNRVLAALHSVNIEEAGLNDYGRPGNYFQRQVDRWSAQYRASETRKIPEMDQLIAWLEKSIPADDGRVALSHGDFRLDNLIFHPSEPRVIAVLDWELSTLGHPFADLAYQCSQLRLPGGEKGMAGLGGIDRKTLGIPSEAEYVARYCERMGIENIPNWSFYLAFCFFRLAAILQGVVKRAQDGNASSKKAASYATAIEPLAKFALDVINNEN